MQSKISEDNIKSGFLLLEDFTTIYNNKPKLLDQLRETLRLKHYSLKTEKSYFNWVCRVILFHNKRHPKEMETVEVQAFLNYLTVELHFSASTQNQALNASVYLYKHEKKELGVIDAIRARRSKHLPVVLTREEVKLVHPYTQIKIKNIKKKLLAS